MLQWAKKGLARRKIFISYRRTDAGGYAGQLLAKLEDHYGGDAIFLDHQDIDAGAKWEVVLDDALEAADVVLVLIGPEWTEVVESTGTSRLFDPDDWVRREVEAGLQRSDSTVIPVLVGHAEVPVPDELPNSIVGLLERQAQEIRPERFDLDVRHLIRSIGGWRSHWYGLSAAAWVSAAVALALIVALGVALARRDTNQPPVLPERLPVTVDAGDVATIDLLANATDDTGEVALRAAGPLSREGGRVEPAGNGVVTYEPTAGFHGRDVFTYSVADEDGAVSEGNVAIQVQIGPMRGDFNVAVATFARLDEAGTGTVDDDSKLFADRVYEGVDTELAMLNETGNFNFEVRSPTDTGPIEGATRAERAAAARDLAIEIEADVIVYGTLTDEGITPEFFIHARDRNLINAEELAGDHELGARIFASSLGAGSITENATTLRAFGVRTRALTQFVIGLSWYSGRNYTEALEAFQQADEPEWLNSDGKEILFLLLGNAAGKLADIDRADEFYDQALSLNDQFARALLGRAEVEFFRAAILGRVGACDPGDVDAEGLARSEQVYLDARAALDRPSISNVDAKSAFGLGRVYLCMTRAEVDDRSAAAAAELQKVVDDFDAGNESIQNLAAESYASLGLLGFVDAADSDAAALCEVVALYDAARALTDDREREAAFEAVQSQARDRIEGLGQTCS